MTKIKLRINILAILSFILIIMIYCTNIQVFAETLNPEEFSVSIEYFDGKEIVTYKNLDKFDVTKKDSVVCLDSSIINVEDRREVNILHMLGFSDAQIKDMPEESIEVYSKSSFIQQVRQEYNVLERETNLVDRKSATEEYNKLIVTNTLAKIGNVNGNDRYIANMNVFWTSEPVNKLKDIMYIACGNGSTIGSSPHRYCNFSYVSKIIVPGIGTIGPETISYSNNDGSKKIVQHNKQGGEGWKIDIPFVFSYNQYHYDYTFNMQSEVSVSPNVNLASVYFAYMHQKIVGTADFSISISGAALSFTPNYTMDLFTGPYYTIENGEIV